ncbi:carboxypeptidase regulatory-like domain-containing protein [Pseudonocardia sp. CA-107938]|uniref:carboxypeptidase regulatory-like domain-containing protein n=1 Tax=Pseudonocardia sp. CA-107938 TaxID=3240021 RepID=UPI003D89BFF8
MSTIVVVVSVVVALVVLVALAIWVFLRWLRRHETSARHRTGPRTVAELVELRGVEGKDVPAAIAPEVVPAAAEAVEEPEPPAPAAVPAAARPRPPVNPEGADTPWARGARMTGDPDGPGEPWADAEQPAQAKSRSWVPGVITGAAGATGLAAVAAHQTDGAEGEPAAEGSAADEALSKESAADGPATEEPAAGTVADGGEPAAEESAPAEEPAGNVAGGEPADAGETADSESMAGDSASAGSASDESAEGASAPEPIAEESSAAGASPAGGEDAAPEEPVASGPSAGVVGLSAAAGLAGVAGVALHGAQSVGEPEGDQAATDDQRADAWLPADDADTTDNPAGRTEAEQAEEVAGFGEGAAAGSGAGGPVEEEVVTEATDTPTDDGETEHDTAADVITEGAEAAPTPVPAVAEGSAEGSVADPAGPIDVESAAQPVEAGEPAAAADGQPAASEQHGGAALTVAGLAAAAAGGVAVAGLAGRSHERQADEPGEDGDEAATSLDSTDREPALPVAAAAEAPSPAAGADPAAGSEDGPVQEGGAVAASDVVDDPAEDDPSVAGPDWADEPAADEPDDDPAYEDEEGAGPTGADLAAVHAESAAEQDRRPRRTPAERAAEHAAVDVALLRTFGVAETGDRPSAAPIVSLSAATAHPAPRDPSGPAMPVFVRVSGRDDEPVEAASVALVDDLGTHVAAAETGPDGKVELTAPGPGTYMVVASAAQHQPGAGAVVVAGGPATVTVPLVRSSSVAGSVWGAEEAVAEAQLVLLQDGEVVEEVQSGGDGGFRIADLTAGTYTLSVTASGFEQLEVALDVPVATDVRQDIDLQASSLVGQ